MKYIYTLLSLFLLSSALEAQDLVINEVDADQDGTDSAEFIELYGAGNTSLDGYTLVLYNGNDNQSYYAVALDGYSLNSNGYFVIGNVGVPNSDLELPANGLQNGADAVALYLASVEDFPNDTPLTFPGLVDYMVYDTNDPDDEELLALVPGQVQLDENGMGNGAFHSNSRVPDGGTQLDVSTYTQQTPTPGATNSLACDAGVLVNADEEDFEVCVEDALLSTILFDHLNNVEGDSYLYIVTDLNGVIQFTSEDGNLDFIGELPGESLVWGLSYDGTILEGSIASGQDAANIALDGEGCLSLTTAGILVTKINCSSPECDAGDVLVNDAPSVFICNDAEDLEVVFSNTSTTPEFDYAYVIADINQNIVQVQSSDSFDFDGQGDGTWSIYGISHIGELDASSIMEGEPVVGIAAETCLSLSLAASVTISNCSGGCTDLFFSEYIEGSGNNKAIEIYNPMNMPADLSAYTVNLYANGSTDVGNSITLEGILDPGEVFVIGNSSAVPEITELADVLATVTFYNGDDALELVHSGIVIDVIGVVGEDPGSEWEVGTGSTKEHTLVRKNFITQGNTDWSTGATEWDVYDQDELSFLGTHIANSCGSGDVPVVSFSTSSQTVEEGDMVTVTVTIFNPIYEVSLQVDLDGGTATADADFENPFPIDHTFPEGSTESLEISFLVNDDTEEELDETIILSLSANSDDFEITTEIQTITIEDNDAIVEAVNISAITVIDMNGEAESIGEVVQLRGIVYGENLRPGGLQFTLIDPTDGIAVFNLNEDFGYTVVEGDSIHVTGTIAQFNGLTQIEVDDVELMTSDNTLKTPTVVSSLNEITESDLVQINCVQLVDPAAWIPMGSGFNVEITDGTQIYEMRIDNDVDLFEMDAPQGSFDLVGIGGQFDNSSPYNEGYQILPRYAADLMSNFDMTYTITGNIVDDCILIGDTGGAIELNPSYEDGTSYLWEVGELSSDAQVGTLDLFNLSDLEIGVNSVAMTYTVSNVDGCTSSITDTLCIEVEVGIEELETLSFTLYPNPAQSSVHINSDQVIDYVSLKNVLGQVLWTDNLNRNNALVDLNEFPNGIYFIEAVSRTKRSVQRIVIEK